MQTVKTFVYGKDRIALDYNTEPLDSQVNAYMKEHPGYTITSFSTIVGSGFHEAFVVFDIPDSDEKPTAKETLEPEQKQEREQDQAPKQKFNKKEYKNNN